MHPARAGGSPSTPTTGLPLVLGLRAVEEDLERLYEAKTGGEWELGKAHVLLA